MALFVDHEVVLVAFLLVAASTNLILVLPANTPLNRDGVREISEFVPVKSLFKTSIYD